MRRVLVVLVSIVACLVLAVSWLGLVQVPVLSAAFGMDRPRDLQMAAPDRAEFEAFAKANGIETPSDTGNYTLSSKHYFHGTVQVDDYISEAALASVRELTHGDARFDRIQFRLHDGYVEASAMVNAPGYPVSGPMYAKFTIAKSGEQSIALDIQQLDIGRIGVPGNITGEVENTVQDYLNRKIVEAGIKFEVLSFEEGQIRFKGTWPKTITVDPPRPGDLP